MGDYKFIFWFNFIVGPLLGGFAAYWVSASVLAEFSWCITAEEHCVRNWVSALSGWAAAITAGATIFYLRWENRRRELLEWREIVNSAELLRGTLEPQVNLLLGAVKFEHNVQTPEWLVPCLERIHAAISNADNQGYRKASAGVAVLRDTALRLAAQSIVFSKACLNAQRLPSDYELSHLAFNHEFLERLLHELEQVVASARNPRDYRGV